MDGILVGLNPHQVSDQDRAACKYAGALGQHYFLPDSSRSHNDSPSQLCQTSALGLPDFPVYYGVKYSYQSSIVDLTECEAEL